MSIELFMIKYVPETSMTFATNLHLQFSDSSLEPEQLLLEGCLLTLKGGDLLLNTTVLGFLEVEMSLPRVKLYVHFFFDAN